MTTTTVAAVAAMTTATTAMAVVTATVAGTDINQRKVAAEEATVAEATVGIRWRQQRLMMLQMEKNLETGTDLTYETPSFNTRGQAREQPSFEDRNP